MPFVSPVPQASMFQFHGLKVTQLVAWSAHVHVQRTCAPLRGALSLPMDSALAGGGALRVSATATLTVRGQRAAAYFAATTGTALRAGRVPMHRVLSTIRSSHCNGSLTVNWRWCEAHVQYAAVLAAACVLVHAVGNVTAMVPEKSLQIRHEPRKRETSQQHKDHSTTRHSAASLQIARISSTRNSHSGSLSTCVLVVCVSPAFSAV
jgi:hypothetical protein